MISTLSIEKCWHECFWKSSLWLHIHIHIILISNTFTRPGKTSTRIGYKLHKRYTTYVYIYIWGCVKIRVWIGPRWSRRLDRSGLPAFWYGSGVWIGLWVQGIDRGFTFWLANHPIHPILTLWATWSAYDVTMWHIVDLHLAAGQNTGHTLKTL